MEVPYRPIPSISVLWPLESALATRVEVLGDASRAQVVFRSMNVAEVIEIALANFAERRVEVAALEPADISMGTVSGLTQLVAELVDNALAFSGPDDVVRVTGLHDQGNYLLSISDRGVGVPEHLINELNRTLEDAAWTAPSESRPGIAVVARLASRHGIEVRLVPGAPGTTARVTVPGRLAARVPDEAPPEAEAGHDLLPPGELSADELFAQPGEFEDTVDLTGLERDHRAGSGVVAMSEQARREAEVFLEKVFAPLMRNPGMTERPDPRPPTNGNGIQSEPSTDPGPPGERGGTVTALRVRVPGENFSLVDDEPSTIAAEGAIDIRSALSHYQQGRRSAESSRYES